jgi:hypothetical protein
MGPPLWPRRGRSFCVGATFVAPWFQLEYIRAVTTSRSLWILCVLCRWTTLCNIYYEIYRDSLSMQPCAAGYALTYVTILKRPAGSCHLASGRTQQKTPFLVVLLLHNVAISADGIGYFVPSGSPICYVAWGIPLLSVLCQNQVTDVSSD